MPKFIRELEAIKYDGTKEALDAALALFGDNVIKVVGSALYVTERLIWKEETHRTTFPLDVKDMYFYKCWDGQIGYMHAEYFEYTYKQVGDDGVARKMHEDKDGN